MPNWNGIILTNKGRVLQAKVEAGETLNLTKLKLGSGIISEGQSLEALTDLIRPEQNLGIAAKTAMENGFTKIEATITNAGLEEGYYVRELGVFAQDPDDGEILYAVTTDTAPDYLPAQGGAAVLSQEFAVYITTSNVDHIEATIDPTALATVGFVNLTIDAHNTSDAAHENRFSLFQKIATLGDEIIKKLALTTTITVINALQTNSWFGQLLQMVLNASGVKYSMAQNGYICLGVFFGGLIIQWGYDSQNDSAGNVASYSITIPLSTSQVFSYATGSSGDDLTNIQSISGNTMIVKTFRSLQTDAKYWVKRPFHYIIVCK